MKHDQREIFDSISFGFSRAVTGAYSTSFSFGIRMLEKRFRDAICSVYGFVRFGDEIVDTFHDHDKKVLLQRYRQETYNALQDKISLNPVLNSFQKTCGEYDITRDLIDRFLLSMEMDLDHKEHDSNTYKSYVLGSAEVVGLMCLKVFTEGNRELYESLSPSAMRLGAAFQKINFLRDLKADYLDLGRAYFPGLDMNHFTEDDKLKIEKEIEEDFRYAYQGIVQLPKDARLGVFVAYVYYRSLFARIRSLPSHRIMQERIRIGNHKKLALLMGCYIRNNFNML